MLECLSETLGSGASNWPVHPSSLSITLPPRLPDLFSVLHRMLHSISRYLSYNLSITYVCSVPQQSDKVANIISPFLPIAC